jgi:hypothetical protein
LQKTYKDFKKLNTVLVQTFTGDNVVSALIPKLPAKKNEMGSEILAADL